MCLKSKRMLYEQTWISIMDNYDLTSYIVGKAVRELDELQSQTMQNRKRWWPEGDFDAGFDILWDALRNPILNLLEVERPEYNQQNDQS